MSLDDWIKKPKKASSKKSQKKAPEKKEKEPPDSEPRPELEDSKPSTLGLHKYELRCSKCKFKKTVRISGELKEHHKLCKKCGSEMKLVKSE
ncbi:MAG: hypothetical protein ACFFCS_09070 [Candidatus Hodarchaeota archaeon]